jgi:hypothetical protein
MPQWRVATISVRKGRSFEWLGTVEAPNFREACRLAIEQFKVPVERQSRLFVTRADEKA